MLGDIQRHTPLPLHADGGVEVANRALGILERKQTVVQKRTDRNATFLHSADELVFPLGVAIEEGDRFAGNGKVVMVAILGWLGIGADHFIQMRTDDLCVSL